ncbi:hypothetical protein [Staphylococcus hominis]|uniref:hypothetical protein n=1 Tax=Staphylococcus hominis TaxID=1290 RepID=UPI00119E85E2|nr:hypothetical protein [Staphylococcus hominis]
MKFNKKTECLLYVLLGVFSGIIGSSIMIFIIYNYENKKEFIKITISIVGLFTTFGGAYLGARVSAKYSAELERKRQENATLEKFKQYKTLLKMNSYHLYSFHTQICFSYQIKKEEFLKNLEEDWSKLYDGYTPKEIEKNRNIKFFDEHAPLRHKDILYLRKEDLKHIEYFLKVLNEVNLGMHYFLADFQNLIFQLNQVLSNMKEKIQIKDQKYYINISDSNEKIIFKGNFMLLSLLHINFSKEIA